MADLGGSFQPLPPPPAAAGGDMTENSSHGDGGGGAAAPTAPAMVVPATAAPSGVLAMGAPTPASALAPLGGEYTTASAVGAVMRPGRALTLGSTIGSESSGEMVACVAGANFTPHIITVATGEDVGWNIESFLSQQSPRAICILSAIGTISEITLGSVDCVTGSMTFEDRFELISLSGLFVPTENGGTRNFSGGMSVLLSTPNGSLLGGAVAGLCIAADPMHVVVGSFLPSYQIEQTTRRARRAAPIRIFGTEIAGPSGSGQVHQSSLPQSGIITTAPSHGVETSAAAPLQATPEPRRPEIPDINVTLPGW